MRLTSPDYILSVSTIAGKQMLNVMEADSDHMCSLTIDIELDNDEQYALTQLSYNADDSSPHNSLETFYDAPPTAAEVRPHVGSEVYVRHLPQLAFRQFELYMNPPSYGSMRNWEYLASSLGLSNNEIMARIPYLSFYLQQLSCLRTSDSPTRAVLQRFLNCPLNRILDVICELNRIDVLVALKPYVNGMNASADALSDVTSDSAVAWDDGNLVSVPGAFFDEPGPSVPVVASTAHRAGTSENRHIQRAAEQSLGGKCKVFCGYVILVTHHEEEASADLRKNFKWLMKNLRKHGEQSEVSVFNIEECANERDMLGGLHSIFENAMHIVCVFSEDYAQMLRSDSDSQCVAMKKYLHNLMNAEYVRKLGVNQRFRAVILQAFAAVRSKMQNGSAVMLEHHSAAHFILGSISVIWSDQSSVKLRSGPRKKTCSTGWYTKKGSGVPVVGLSIEIGSAVDRRRHTLSFLGVSQQKKNNSVGSMRLFVALFVLTVSTIKIHSKSASTQSDRFEICTPDTPCSCEGEDGQVNCDNVFWTEDEEAESIYQPLRTTNLVIKKKDFKAQIAYFRNNDIPRLVEGQILPGHESTLKELDFSFNRIYDLQNSVFKEMSNLRILRLGHNKLRRLRSESFKGGPNWKLHQLYVEYNDLTELPASLFEEMPNLEKLVLDGNRKLRLTRELFGSNLSNLKILSLDNCSLSQLDEDLFDDLT
ncbi:unnamed protein product [Toxocara canis]|uniref:SEFIR domain-containing protein n=1 Tax=Toxocara canis TaxID=6265 RepID=A0A183UPL0_TOXCA|nr:unnamed protein product [Toxocara canis]